jgi:hypothetical protein
VRPRLFATLALLPVAVAADSHAALQAHCGDCHAASRSTDWLFRTYLPAADDSRAPRER